jgi:hypothetical protein
MEDKNKPTAVVPEDAVDTKNSIKDQMYWWLNPSRPFFIGDEYKIELGKIDRKNGAVKIIITNLKALPDEDVIFESKLTKILEQDKSIVDLLSMFSGETSNADEP